MLKYTKHRLTARANSISLFHLSHRNINVASHVIWYPYFTYSLLWRAVQFFLSRIYIRSGWQTDIHAVNTSVREMNVHSWAWLVVKVVLNRARRQVTTNNGFVSFLGKAYPIRLASIAGRALCREQDNSTAERAGIFKVKLSLSYM